MELVMIALRNVFRNRRRSLLNIVAIALGVMILLTLRGWVGGFAVTAYQTQVDLDTAHVQVLDARYQSQARRMPLDLGVKDWPAVAAVLRQLPGVAGVTARLDFAAQVSNGETALGVQVRGVDPEGEAATTTLRAQIITGTWLTDDNEVLVGSGLAAKLGLTVGSAVFLTALDQYGVKNFIEGRVGGVFTSGYGLFDDAVVYVTLAKAQETLALGPGDATRLAVRFSGVSLASGPDLERKAGEVKTALDARGLGSAAGLGAWSWRTFSLALVNTVESRIQIMTLMVIILLLLVTVGILNSMSMAVQERFREIGTLRAIGMNRRKLARLFLAEGFFLGLTGGLVGMSLALVLSVPGSVFGLDARGFLPRDVPIPLVSVLRPLYWWHEFPLAALGAAGIAVIGSFLPARKAGRLVIRDALGSHG